MSMFVWVVEACFENDPDWWRGVNVAPTMRFGAYPSRREARNAARIVRGGANILCTRVRKYQPADEN